MGARAVMKLLRTSGLAVFEQLPDLLVGTQADQGYCRSCPPRIAECGHAAFTRLVALLSGSRRHGGAHPAHRSGLRRL